MIILRNSPTFLLIFLSIFDLQNVPTFIKFGHKSQNEESSKNLELCKTQPVDPTSIGLGSGAESNSVNSVNSSDSSQLDNVCFILPKFRHSRLESSISITEGSLLKQLIHGTFSYRESLLFLTYLLYSYAATMRLWMVGTGCCLGKSFFEYLDRNSGVSNQPFLWRKIPSRPTVIKPRP